MKNLLLYLERNWIIFHFALLCRHSALDAHSCTRVDQKKKDQLISWCVPLSIFTVNRFPIFFSHRIREKEKRLTSSSLINKSSEALNMKELHIKIYYFFLRREEKKQKCIKSIMIYWNNGTNHTFRTLCGPVWVQGKKIPCILFFVYHSFKRPVFSPNCISGRQN